MSPEKKSQMFTAISRTPRGVMVWKVIMYTIMPMAFITISASKSDSKNVRKVIRSGGAIRP